MGDLLAMLGVTIRISFSGWSSVYVVGRPLCDTAAQALAVRAKVRRPNPLSCGRVSGPRNSVDDLPAMPGGHTLIELCWAEARRLGDAFGCLILMPIVNACTLYVLGLSSGCTEDRHQKLILRVAASTTDKSTTRQPEVTMKRRHCLHNSDAHAAPPPNKA